jgi:hypothetical protein
MMESEDLSETLVVPSTLTRLIARENFSTFIGRGSLKYYVIFFPLIIFVTNLTTKIDVSKYSYCQYLILSYIGMWCELGVYVVTLLIGWNVSVGAIASVSFVISSRGLICPVDGSQSKLILSHVLLWDSTVPMFRNPVFVLRNIPLYSDFHP